MPEKTLHIVSFNIPYPPDYGGVIDVFHKIRSLQNAGVSIILHTFEYGRNRSAELENLCTKVYYYPRKTGWISQFSIRPYIIQSRRSKLLLQNLLSDPYPVLFEGLHTTAYLDHPGLNDKLKIVRMHNVEHEYYFRLALSERSPGEKIFHFTEAVRLWWAERRLKHADEIAAISPADARHFSEKFRNTFLLNPFHSVDEVEIRPGRGKYLLFHGNLSVSENIKAVLYLIENVFSKIDFPVVIAGKRPSSTLKKTVEAHQNISIKASPSAQEMKELLRNAHANVLVTFQQTGIKLKLIESLFSGRFCIVNKPMIENTGLEDSCLIGNSPAELIIQIKKILERDFTPQMVEERKDLLMNFNNRINAGKLAEII